MSARSFRRMRRRELDRDRGSRGRVAKRAGVGAASALGATAFFAPAADAATFTVSSLDDSSADGTLRGSIIDANDTAGDDVIVFASGLSGTITLDDPAGALEITNEGGLQIQGPGAGVLTVAGDGSDRIFYIHSLDDPGESVSISGLTLTGGNAASDGGAVYNVAGPDNAANLTISDSVLSDNTADGFGGAVYSDEANLAIVRSVLQGNEAEGSGGGAVFVQNTSGTSADDVEVLFETSTLSNNLSQGWGGAFYLSHPDGTAVVSRSTLTGNESTNGGGGAIDVVEIQNGGDFVVDQSTISDNAGLYEGGAINLSNVEGDIIVRNSTLSGNSVSTEEGGGAIYFEGDYGVAGEILIQNSTIAGNSTEGYGGAIYLDEGGPVQISSSILADNSAPDGDLTEDADNDTEGFELGFSLIEGTGGNGTIAETPAGSNIFGLDPALEPLQNNGGPTPTRLPGLASPALEAGIANGLATDQRGRARTSDLVLAPNVAGSDGTDMGAVEIQAEDVEAVCQATTVRRLGGTAGDDSVTGTDASEALFGLAGNDTANGAGGNDCVNGDEGKDKLKGGPGKDVVKGGAGKDRASGNGGKDKVKGQAGKDKLKGGGGKDKLSGGGGKDKLSGGGGKDKLKGGPGKDRIKTGGGRDKVNCGSGNDTVNAGANDKVAANCETVT